MSINPYYLNRVKSHTNILITPTTYILHIFFIGLRPTFHMYAISPRSFLLRSYIGLRCMLFHENPVMFKILTIAMDHSHSRPCKRKQYLIWLLSNRYYALLRYVGSLVIGAILPRKYLFCEDNLKELFPTTTSYFSFVLIVIRLVTDLFGIEFVPGVMCIIPCYVFLERSATERRVTRTGTTFLPLLTFPKPHVL